MHRTLWLLAGLAACGSPQSTTTTTPDATMQGAEAGTEAVEVPKTAAKAPQTLTMTTDAGDVQITPVYHATVRIEHAGKTLWVDPWSKANLKGATKADVILITDIHQDHLDRAAIDAVATPDTVFVAPRAVANDPRMAGRTVQHVLANGEQTTVAGIGIQAVPMYNLVRGPEEGGLFHDKGRGNGYVLTIGGKRLYIAGDTECTAEMKALTGIDHALIPMNLPYTMPPEEAAACVKAFKPVVVTPIHYAGSDLAVFQTALEGVDGVSVVRVDAYPGGLPW